MSGEAEKPAIFIHRDGETKRIATDGPDAYQLQLEDFASAIEGEHAPLLGRDDAVAQAAAIEALYASAEAGRAVALISGRG
jgi:predicted dehydrogenase